MVINLAQMLEFSPGFMYGLLIYLLFGTLGVIIHLWSSVGVTLEIFYSTRSWKRLFDKEQLNYFKEPGTLGTCLLIFICSALGFIVVLISLRGTPLRIVRQKLPSRPKSTPEKNERNEFGIPTIH